MSMFATINGGLLGLCCRPGAVDADNVTWWREFVLFAKVEQVPELGSENAFVRYYALRNDTVDKVTKLTTIPLTSPPEQVFGDKIDRRIVGFTERRQYWSHMPQDAGLPTYHTYMIIEIAGDCYIVLEKKTSQLEIMFGEGPVVCDFMHEFRATGRGRNVRLCVNRPAEKVTSQVTVRQLMEYVDGPLAKSWKPYDLFQANCQHFSQELLEFLRDPSSAGLEMSSGERAERIEELGKAEREPLTLTTAPDRLRYDRKFVVAAVERNWRCLQYLPYDFMWDFTVVRSALAQEGLALQNIDTDLRNDKEIVLTAVQNNGEALQFAPPELQADQDVVLAAVTQSGSALQYASIEMKRDRRIILAASLRDPLALQHAQFVARCGPAVCGA